MCFLPCSHKFNYSKFRGRQGCKGKWLGVFAKIVSGKALLESLGQISGLFTHSLSLEIVRVLGGD